MTFDEKKRAWQAFFVQSEAGKEFMADVNNLIASQHQKAETDPELSRDYVQRAKGAREVISKIQSLTVESKTNKVVS